MTNYLFKTLILKNKTKDLDVIDLNGKAFCLSLGLHQLRFYTGARAYFVTYTDDNDLIFSLEQGFCFKVFDIKETEVGDDITFNVVESNPVVDTGKYNAEIPVSEQNKSKLGPLRFIF